MHGEGREWRRNFSFQGEFVNGQRAKGKFEREELTYIGTLKDDKFHGEGKLTLKDGTVYEGSFV